MNPDNAKTKDPKEDKGSAEKVKARGEVLIQVVRDGKVIEERKIDNLIVDVGKNFYARRIDEAAFTSTLRQIALGKGTTSPAAGDTNLETAFTDPTDVAPAAKAVAVVVQGPIVGNTAKFVATFPAGASELITVGAIISEAILLFDTSDLVYVSATGVTFSLDGGIFARISFTPFAKTVTDQLIITWRATVI